MRLRPGARQRRVREQPQAPPFTVERSRWRPCPKEPLRGHVSGAHMGKPSNAADALLGRNPKGRGSFRTFRRCSSLIRSYQPSLLTPWTPPRPGARSVECGSGGGYTAIAIACGGPTRFRTGATRNREPVGVRK